jgi:HEAT repeat protein
MSHGSCWLTTGSSGRSATRPAAETDGGGKLQARLAHPDPCPRARAATALGRLPLGMRPSDVTRPLVAALEDASPGVRAAAAFALGMRGDPAAEAD